MGNGHKAKQKNMGASTKMPRVSKDANKKHVDRPHLPPLNETQYPQLQIKRTTATAPPKLPPLEHDSGLPLMQHPKTTHPTQPQTQRLTPVSPAPSTETPLSSTQSPMPAPPVSVQKSPEQQMEALYGPVWSHTANRIYYYTNEILSASYTLTADNTYIFAFINNLPIPKNQSLTLMRASLTDNHKALFDQTEQWCNEVNSICKFAEFLVEEMPKERLWMSEKYVKDQIFVCWVAWNRLYSFQQSLHKRIQYAQRLFESEQADASALASKATKPPARPGEIKSSEPQILEPPSNLRSDDTVLEQYKQEVLIEFRRRYSGKLPSLSSSKAKRVSTAVSAAGIASASGTIASAAGAGLSNSGTANRLVPDSSALKPAATAVASVSPFGSAVSLTGAAITAGSGMASSSTSSQDQAKETFESAASASTVTRKTIEAFAQLLDFVSPVADIAASSMGALAGGFSAGAGISQAVVAASHKRSAETALGMATESRLPDSAAIGHIAQHAKSRASTDLVSGSIRAVSGALASGAGILAASGVGAGIGTALSVLSVATGLIGLLYTKISNKLSSAEYLESRLSLEEHIFNLWDISPYVNRHEATEIVLKVMGVGSGDKSDALDLLYNQDSRFIYDLVRSANAEEKKAGLSLLKALGLSPTAPIKDIRNKLKG